MFKCNMCKPNQATADSVKSVNMMGNLIEKMEMFCYFEDVLCTEGKVRESVTQELVAKI